MNAYHDEDKRKKKKKMDCLRADLPFAFLLDLLTGERLNKHLNILLKDLHHTIQYTLTQLYADKSWVVFEEVLINEQDCHQKSQIITSLQR